MQNNTKLAPTPKLRFPEFQHESWQEKPIGDFLQESRIKGSSGKTARKLTVKLWGKGVCEKIESLSGSENTQYYRRKAGQFIYSKLDFLNQAFGIIPPELDGLESTADLPCFDVSSELHPNFLLEYVKRPSFYKKFGEIADGGRKAKRIQPESFLSFPIRIPRQFAEQQKIAECLSTLDELIEAESRKLDALKDYKKGLMQQLFPREGETRPRLRFPEFRNAPAWEKKRLGDLVEIATGQVDPKKPPYCDLPQIGSENIESSTAKIVNVKTAREKGVISGNYVFHKGDVLYSKIRPALNKVAAPNFTGVCSADIYPVRPSSGSLIRYYLMFLLLSEQFLRYAIRSSDRGKIPKINREALLSYEAQVPSVEEQRCIADCLSSLDDLIAAQSERLESLRTHKRGLMQQLFPNPSELET